MVTTWVNSFRISPEFKILNQADYNRFSGLFQAI